MNKMASYNYKELGFKCGLEIHQQLEGKKLFCNCPAEIKKEKPDFKFIRRLRASAGESGKVDQAAAYELEKSKEFEYEAYHDTTCLVEMDEEPPHPVNEEALEAALIAAKLLNMKIVDSIQFMRKTVIDGSNVSGFQRTALIGTDGFIEINGKKIVVDSLCLEEEAAQVVKRGKKKDVYNISRLGIPLLEIATDASISNPEECKEAAAHIGMILRSTGKCKRGIGSIRQDVNISIEGGARIEIKGFQDIKNIPLVINNEIDRQLKLIKTKKPVESAVRKAEPDGTTSYLRPMPGADRMYPETDIPVIEPQHIHIKKVETLKEKQERYEKQYKLSKDLSLQAVKYESKENYSFEEDFKEFKKVEPKFIVDVLLIKAPSIIKKENYNFNPLDFKKELFSGKINYSSLEYALNEIGKSGKLDLSKFEQISDEEIEKVVKKIIEEHPDTPKGLIMGKSMQALKGKADGKKVNEIVNKLLG